MKTCFSRRDLYAHGEPLGDCVTRPKLGGGYVCGFGGDSSSSSSQTTNNYDKRVVTNDGFGLSGDSNNVALTTTTTNNITDAGIVKRGLDTVDDTITRALNSINVNNATNAEGFQSLLNAADSLWNRGEKLIGQTQQSVADAYRTAQTDAKGTIDNKTIIVLAVAGAAALTLATRRK